ncbi:hypothetical protein ACFQZJ_17150 [Maribacter chungangensis]|uniref:Lipoprotein n=1 Tax=Maribacter chungangensis TaxID=1069117 RepID=A0ABW3B8G1_9FLAO
MKRILLFFLVCTILSSCTNDDDNGIDCRLFDPAFPSLYVSLVDENGENLFENGTMNPDSLRVNGNFEGAGFNFNSANEFAVPDADIRKLDNTIGLAVPNLGTFQHTIFWSQNDSIVVGVSGELTKIPCNISYFTPINATYKGAQITLTEVPPLQFLLVLEL